MRFSISASSCSSWRRRSSCSRSLGSPASRRRSGGGSAAISRRICASSCCCCCSSWSMRRRASSAASPSCTEGATGSGDAARPWAASPPPARLTCAMACACVGASVLRALTRITSKGVSRKARSKRSGSTKRTVSTAPCTVAEASSAQCSVVRSRQCIFVGRTLRSGRPPARRRAARRARPGRWRWSAGRWPRSRHRQLLRRRLSRVPRRRAAPPAWRAGPASAGPCR